MSFPYLSRRWNICIALAAIAIIILLQPVAWQYDSRWLARSVCETLAWLHGGNHPNGESFAPFAPFQFITGLLAATIHLDLVRFWSWFSTLSLVGLSLLMFREARKSGVNAWAILVILLGGPLIVYATSTFNELPAALAIAAFAAVVTSNGNPILACALCAAATITKETAFPLIIILWIAAFAAKKDRPTRSQIFAHVSALVLGLAFGVAMNVGLNYFRYGVAWNRFYLSDGMIVGRLSWSLEYAAGLWVSPNGGLIFFWPTLAIACIAIILFARKRGGLRNRIAVFGIAELLILLTAGLSRWYTPLGGSQSWGPRLMLPWMPAVLLVLIRSQGETTDRWISACLSAPRRYCVSAIIILAVALPQVMGLLQPDLLDTFYDSQQLEIRAERPSDPSRQHAYIHDVLWLRRPWLLQRAILFLPDPMTAAAATIYLGALFVLLQQARSNAQCTTAALQKEESFMIDAN